MECSEFYCPICNGVLEGVTDEEHLYYCEDCDLEFYIEEAA